MKALSLFCRAAVAAWVAATPIVAAPPLRAQTEAAALTTPSRPIPYKSVINSVAPDGSSIRIGKAKTRVLKLTPATRVLKGDTPAGRDALHPGEEVRGSYRKLPNGELEAITIRLGSKPAWQSGGTE